MGPRPLPEVLPADDGQAGLAAVLRVVGRLVRSEQVVGLSVDNAGVRGISRSGLPGICARIDPEAVDPAEGCDGLGEAGAAGEERLNSVDPVAPGKVLQGAGSGFGGSGSKFDQDLAGGIGGLGGGGRGGRQDHESHETAHRCASPTKATKPHPVPPGGEGDGLWGGQAGGVGPGVVWGRHRLSRFPGQRRVRMPAVVRGAGRRRAWLWAGGGRRRRRARRGSRWLRPACRPGG